MRALAITGIETAAMMPSIMSGSLIRETPPWARMSAGTRSRAMTATAPASSAILACSAVTTSMMTPPLSISAMPRLTRAVPVTVAVLSVDTGDLAGDVAIGGPLHGKGLATPLRTHPAAWDADHLARRRRPPDASTGSADERRRWVVVHLE